MSAHPVAVAQLAIQYCDALVEDVGKRATYFPGFNFNAAPATALGASGSAGRAIVLDALVGRMVDPALATDPVVGDVRGELNSLITRLSAGEATAARTQTIVKATCAALLGSAVTLVQ